MNKKIKSTILREGARSTCVLLLCLALVAPGILVCAQSSPAAPAQQESTKIAPEQLDSLVAPIALYPDNLLAQVLVASTYPLELVQLYQWLQKNPDLQKDQNKLQKKVEKQPWEPSIQAMAILPDTVKWLAEDIQWTTDLGNAFLAQQQDVMDSIQRMRVKAQQKGALKSGEQMKVETQVVESKQIIVIEQSNPEVIYVPQYDPVYAYGSPTWGYPYPPVYYPPYPAGGYLAAGLIGFGVGMAIGGAWGGGGWGWGCGWGGGDININRNNNFNRNTNINGGNRTNINGGGTWQHNPTHRGGAPYGDRGTANRFGGTTRGDTLGNRQGQAKRDLGNRGNDLGNRGGVGDRGGVGNNRGGVGDNRGGFANNKDNRGGISDNRGGRTDNRGGISDNRGNMGGRTSSDRVGSRDLSNNSRGGDRGFGGGSSGFNGGNTRSSSDRGRSSMSSSRGGSSGMSRGGGGMSRGGGGMSRGGGGGRRR